MSSFLRQIVSFANGCAACQSLRRGLESVGRRELCFDRKGVVWALPYTKFEILLAVVVDSTRVVRTRLLPINTANLFCLTPRLAKNKLTVSAKLPLEHIRAHFIVESNIQALIAARL